MALVPSVPFRITVPDDVLADIAHRVHRARVSPMPVGVDWAYGMSPEYMAELRDHWLHRFDWRVHEARLNRFPQYVADVDGVPIHFVHQRGVGPTPLSLILSHGWPSSFVEMERLIPLTRSTSSCRHSRASRSQEPPRAPEGCRKTSRPVGRRS